MPGPLGDVLTALVIAGAFAAFLSTSSGLVVSLAGVISQDLLGGSVRGFRIAAVISSFVPLVVALATESTGLAGSVGLVFAFTASTLCPVLILGIWWRGLTARGAIAGMLTGAVLSGVGDPRRGRARRGIAARASRPFLEQPAAWTVPLAVLVTVLVSRGDRRGVPARHRRVPHPAARARAAVAVAARGRTAGGARHRAVPVLLPVALSVLVGAMAHVASPCMGFALIAAPALVILLGPFDGVVIVNRLRRALVAVDPAAGVGDVDWTAISAGSSGPA